jgi:hypothetical protein
MVVEKIFPSYLRLVQFSNLIVEEWDDLRRSLLNGHCKGKAEYTSSISRVTLKILVIILLSGASFTKLACILDVTWGIFS